jgi:hypothetical protein
MSDPVAEAAAQLVQQPAEPTLLETAMNTIHDLEAKVEHLIHPEAVSVGIESKPSLESAPLATAEVAAPVTGNVLVNAAPVVEGNVDTGTSGSTVPAISSSRPSINSDANVGESGSQATGAEASDLPRASHLMLLEAKISGFRAKLANAERVALDEFEAIVGHVKAVL